jgi:uncharacterized protein (TIGR03000 family)
MYSVVLMTAMMTATTSPAWHRGCSSCSCSCYSGYAGYAGYAGYGCYGCSGCGGCTVQGYGFAGGCYGYHGGCYGGWGIYTGDPYLGGCTGCYGCYGGYACYGIPVPISTQQPQRPSADPFPAINPNPPVSDKDKPEVVVPPAEKKKEAPKKPGEGEEQVRAKVRIEIPEGGKLFVDGRLINVTPGTRIFQTPALAAGETYFYDIRIEVERQGAIQSEQRRVIIRSGEDVAVSFPNLRPSGTQTARENK